MEFSGNIMEIKRFPLARGAVYPAGVFAKLLFTALFILFLRWNVLEREPRHWRAFHARDRAGRSRLKGSFTLA